MIEEKCNAYINTCSESSIKAVVFLPSPTNVSELRKLQTESKTLSMSLFRLLESVPYSRDNVLEVKEKLELVDKYMYMLSENDLSIEKLAAILNNASSRTQDFNIAVINLIKDITERIQRCLYENRTLEEVQNQFKKEQ